MGNLLVKEDFDKSVASLTAGEELKAKIISKATANINTFEKEDLLIFFIAKYPQFYIRYPKLKRKK